MTLCWQMLVEATLALLFHKCHQAKAKQQQKGNDPLEEVSKCCYKHLSILKHQVFPGWPRVRHPRPVFIDNSELSTTCAPPDSRVCSGVFISQWRTSSWGCNEKEHIAVRAVFANARLRRRRFRLLAAPNHLKHIGWTSSVCKSVSRFAAYTNLI